MTRNPTYLLPAIALITALSFVGSAEAQDNQKNQPYYSPSYGLYQYGRTWKFPQPDPPPQTQPRTTVNNFFIPRNQFGFQPNPFGFPPSPFFFRQSTRNSQRAFQSPRTIRYGRTVQPYGRGSAYYPYATQYARPYGW
ncbi:MAG: hypothetical protein AAFX06_17285 [Planctomycetota bacterium]